MSRPVSRLLVLLATLGTACSSEPKAAVTVTIDSPAEGDTVTGNAVHVMLGISGIELAPVTEGRAGTAHHHLYLDTDLPSTEDAIPAGVPNIIHLGLGQSEYHWANVLPGAHRIIAVPADPAHVPLQPFVADTVNFVVVAPQDTSGTK